ncbi:MAG: RNA polymerase sigma factor SigJ [Planctomycetota bacterium]
MFAEHRPYLFAAAYRMLGVAEDAEDVLQDAWLRFSTASATDLRNPRAYLVTIVTRLSVDLLRSARKRREEYVGVWLPEPVQTRDAIPEELMERADSASFAFLLLLERLSPLQRAVLVLYDVLDYSHDEVSTAIGRTPAASRQILRRARLKLGDATPTKTLPKQETRELADRFCQATRSGDVEALIGALAPDVVLMSDGGGRVAAVSRPLAGNARVGRFLATVRQQGGWGPIVLTELNAQPTVLIHEDGVLTNALLMDVTRAGITAIYVVRNPDKLGRLAEAARVEP